MFTCLSPFYGLACSYGSGKAESRSGLLLLAIVVASLSSVTSASLGELVARFEQLRERPALLCTMIDSLNKI